jgi:hypothetical protein
MVLPRGSPIICTLLLSLLHITGIHATGPRNILLLTETGECGPAACGGNGRSSIFNSFPDPRFQNRTHFMDLIPAIADAANDLFTRKSFFFFSWLCYANGILIQYVKRKVFLLNIFFCILPRQRLQRRGSLWAGQHPGGQSRGLGSGQNTAVGSNKRFHRLVVRSELASLLAGGQNTAVAPYQRFHRLVVRSELASLLDGGKNTAVGPHQPINMLLFLSVMAMAAEGLVNRIQ